MKKFFNKQRVFALVMAFTITAVAALGVCLSSFALDTENEVYNSQDSKTYFKSRQIDYNQATHVNLSIDDHKHLIIYALTDYKNPTTTAAQFRYTDIKENILTLFKEIIAGDARFQIIDNFYLNIKFQIISYSCLLVDVRWANRIAIKNQGIADLYWEKIKFDLQSD